MGGVVDGAAVRGIDQLTNRCSIDGLCLEEGVGDCDQAIAVQFEEFTGALLLCTEDYRYLVVDDAAEFIAVVLGRHEAVTEEHLLVATPGHWTNLG